MPTVTTKAPLPVDTDALKLYRVSSHGAWMPCTADTALKVTPDAGWYVMEWHICVEAAIASDNGHLWIQGGGLKCQDANGNGTYNFNANGTSISVNSDNAIAASRDRLAQGSLIMFLDGTEISIHAVDDQMSHMNQIVFTRFALPNGSDLG